MGRRIWGGEYGAENMGWRIWGGEYGAENMVWRIWGKYDNEDGKVV